MRDIATEAQQWRFNVRDPILLKWVTGLDEEMLTKAYVAWWEAYSKSVRRAPSNPMGGQERRRV